MKYLNNILFFGLFFTFSYIESHDEWYGCFSSKSVFSAQLGNALDWAKEHKKVLAVGIITIAFIGIGTKVYMKHTERCALYKRYKNKIINVVKTEIIDSVAGKTVALQDNIDNYMKQHSQDRERVKVNSFSIMTILYTKEFAKQTQQKFNDQNPLTSEKTVSDNGLKMLLKIKPCYEVSDTCKPGYFVKVTGVTCVLTITDDKGNERFVSPTVKFPLTSQRELVDREAVKSLLVSCTKKRLEDFLDDMIPDENWIN